MRLVEVLRRWPGTNEAPGAYGALRFGGCFRALARTGQAGISRPRVFWRYFERGVRFVLYNIDAADLSVREDGRSTHKCLVHRSSSFPAAITVREEGAPRRQRLSSSSAPCNALSIQGRQSPWCHVRLNLCAWQQQAGSPGESQGSALAEESNFCRLLDCSSLLFIAALDLLVRCNPSSSCVNCEDACILHAKNSRTDI